MTDQVDRDGRLPGLVRLAVDLGALRENYRRVAGMAERTAAVVKANAYGLGAVRVVEALGPGGLSGFLRGHVERGGSRCVQ